MAQLPQEILGDQTQLLGRDQYPRSFRPSPQAPEISGHIHDLEKRIARQRANLANLDATIKLFSPGTNPDAIPPKRAYRRTSYFAHNELSRLTQDALRMASGPLTSAEIAAEIMRAKEMPSGDAAFKEIVAARVLTVLRRLTKRGTVAKSGTSRNAQWARTMTFDRCQFLEMVQLFGASTADVRKNSPISVTN
jgi:hypothetical protein